MSEECWVCSGRGVNFYGFGFLTCSQCHGTGVEEQPRATGQTSQELADRVAALHKVTCWVAGLIVVSSATFGVLILVFEGAR